MVRRHGIFALVFCASLVACAQSGPSTQPSGNEAVTYDQDAASAPVNAATATPEPVAADESTNNVSAPPPAPAAAVSAVKEGYTARGQEPGWLLTIARGRIDYTGNYGEKHINVPLPTASSTKSGRKLAAGNLAVEIVPRRCNDAMSGQGFADTVTIVAEGERYQGCGGERRPAWDM